MDRDLVLVISLIAHVSDGTVNTIAADVPVMPQHPRPKAGWRARDGDDRVHRQRPVWRLDVDPPVPVGVSLRLGAGHLIHRDLCNGRRRDQEKRGKKTNPHHSLALLADSSCPSSMRHHQASARPMSTISRGMFSNTDRAAAIASTRSSRAQCNRYDHLVRKRRSGHPEPSEEAKYRVPDDAPHVASALCQSVEPLRDFSCCTSSCRS